MQVLIVYAILGRRALFEVVRMKMFRYVSSTPPAKLSVAICDIRAREIHSFVCWHSIL